MVSAAATHRHHKSVPCTADGRESRTEHRRCVCQRRDRGRLARHSAGRSGHLRHDAKAEAFRRPVACNVHWRHRAAVVALRHASPRDGISLNLGAYLWSGSCDNVL